jgi:hypothetical protein
VHAFIRGILDQQLGESFGHDQHAMQTGAIFLTNAFISWSVHLQHSINDARRLW